MNLKGMLPFFFTFLMVITLQNILIMKNSTKDVSYDEFKELLISKRISEVIITEKNLRGISTDIAGKVRIFETNIIKTDLINELAPFGVKYRKVTENTFFRDILSWILPPLIFVFLWLFILTKFTGKGGMGGSLMNVGKSKAKVYVEKHTGVYFKDVAGVDEAKQELQEIVKFLLDNERYSVLGGRMPKGVLLVGPPGTGKTMLAKAVAGEAKVPFFSISGSEFVEMFVGVGAARVRDLFEQATKNSPCIIFIDELDALGKARSASGISGGNDEKEQTLNQLLTEMDGFETKSGVVLLAATNRPEILDPALLRAGRFDRQVLVDRPDRLGRVAIIEVHIKNVKVSNDIEIEHIASLTIGFTGADLANLINEAALVATRKNAESVTLKDFTIAIERIIAGLEKKTRILNPFEREVIAHHEMGHAIVGMILSETEEVHKVSIIPRGIGALGYTIQRPTEDRFIMRRDELEGKICILLGGRVAEKIIFDHYSTGASDDLAKTTDIARSMVVSYGMCESLGHVTYEQGSHNLLGQDGIKTNDYSEKTAYSIDLAIKKIIDKCYDRTQSILMEHLVVLKESASLLLEKETLEGEDLELINEKLINQRKAS